MKIAIFGWFHIFLKVTDNFKFLLSFINAAFQIYQQGELDIKHVQPFTINADVIRSEQPKMYKKNLIIFFWSNENNISSVSNMQVVV